MEAVNLPSGAVTAPSSDSVPDAGASTSAYRKPKAVLPPIDVLAHSDPDKVEGPSKRRYISKTFSCFRPAALPRRICIYLVESRLFEPAILAYL